MSTLADFELATLPPAPPEPAPIDITWFGCDLRTGEVVEELPALTPAGAISRRLGAHTTTGFSLPLPEAPDGWDAATEPGRTMIVAVADDRAVWAGMVLTRKGGSAETAQLSCATVEAYFDRRYTRDHTWTEQDESSVIAAGLIGDTQIDGLGLTIDAPPTGTSRDRTYIDADDATVLSRLQELMGVQDGPEWTVDVQWRGGSRTAVELIARVRKRIGVQVDSPNAVFTFPGDVASYDLLESYEQGKGATAVTARGEGEGDTRASSDNQVATDLIAAGWPAFEYRYTPSTSITSSTVLNDHAAAALAILRPGARVWSLQAVASQAPRLGRDWALGDTVGMHIIRSPRHPQGTQVAHRVWGWEWDTQADRITPILAEEA
ncbi:hypothetical protein ACIA59_20110 [Micromonospora haikouensis]|uniref:hypothetical protein n=1 Tax=Micromonospora haikouensis TaxID=686309 RepID=UPI003790E7E0